MSVQELAPETRVRYLLTPPGDTRPSLLVELCPKIDEEILRKARETMFGLSCANALVLDSEHCYVLHDTYATMSPEAIEEEAVLETRRLLGPGEGDLQGRLERWLQALTTNWVAAVPREEWTAPLLMDVVPAASGSVVRRAGIGLTL